MEAVPLPRYRTEAGSPIPEAAKRRDKFYSDIHIWYIDGKAPMKSKFYGLLMIIIIIGYI